MHLQSLYIFLAAALPLVSAKSYRVTTQGLNCRKGPATSYAKVKSYAKDAYIGITCQVYGENVEGVTLWDKTSDGCYVTDKWVHTGTSAMVAPSCNSGGNSGKYRVTTDGLNCRKGPATSYAKVKSYPKGTYVKITCQTHGENVEGVTLWDKTSDGCYVTDKYVHTGTSGMVASACPGSGGGGGGSGDSKFDGPIKRSEIMARAEYWIKKHVAYSMSGYYPDVKGSKYRTDCSGFVSMALHLSTSLNTVTLPKIATPISWNQLQPGDFVGTLGAGTGGAGGHVTLFEKWVDSSKKKYRTLECKGDAGCVRYVRPVGWKVGSHTAKPYRYTRIKA